MVSKSKTPVSIQRIDISKITSPKDQQVSGQWGPVPQLFLKNMKKSVATEQVKKLELNKIIQVRDILTAETNDSPDHRETSNEKERRMRANFDPRSFTKGVL